MDDELPAREQRYADDRDQPREPPRLVHTAVYVDPGGEDAAIGADREGGHAGLAVPLLS